MRRPRRPLIFFFLPPSVNKAIRFHSIPLLDPTFSYSGHAMPPSIFGIFCRRRRLLSLLEVANRSCERSAFCAAINQPISSSQIAEGLKSHFESAS